MPDFGGQTVLVTGGTRSIGRAISEAFLAAGAEFAPATAAGLPEGTRAFRVAGRYAEPPAGDAPLYGPAAPAMRDCQLTFVPYALWGNRGAGHMAVFLPVR